ncbi:hypothetical protein SAMN05192589_112154 [Paracidovorax valerianellae]|uniref:Uncharacterized protein n=2 Tax=Paracidovorax valerianellae TaxID=187868 RepID=A0A1G7AH04_9BURK|nr:hypothetical protein SAMN05192589_112154 [Paracidovorax valerianellae]
MPLATVKRYGTDDAWEDTSGQFLFTRVTNASIAIKNIAMHPRTYCPGGRFGIKPFCAAKTKQRIKRVKMGSLPMRNPSSHSHTQPDNEFCSIIKVGVFMKKISEKLKMRWLVIFLGIFICTACGPSDAQMKDYLEKKRVECLDKFCQGDQPPQRDASREILQKLNGQWFIGPKDYYSGFGAAVFYWPDNAPAFSSDKKKKDNEVAFYETAIEVFLHSKTGGAVMANRYQLLVDAEKQGRLISKGSPRAGLEVWKVRDAIQGMPPAVWYVASQLKDNEGFPPVLGCDDQNPQFDRCTMAFTWQSGVAVDMRFRAKHGPDWPEIYQEMMRVLNLLKKA